MQLIHIVKKLKAEEIALLEKPHATFSLPSHLELNDHNSLVGSANDKPIVGVESRLNDLLVHMLLVG